MVDVNDNGVWVGLRAASLQDSIGANSNTGAVRSTSYVFPSSA